MKKLSDQTQLNIRISEGLKARLEEERARLTLSYPEFLSAMLDRWQQAQVSLGTSAQTPTRTIPTPRDYPARLSGVARPANESDPVVGLGGQDAEDQLEMINLREINEQRPELTMEQAAAEILSRQLDQEIVEARAVETAAARKTRVTRPVVEEPQESSADGTSWDW